MQDYLEEYRVLLKQFVSLQQELTEPFESAVEVVALPDRDPFSQAKDIVRPECSISEILCAWPSDVPLLPFLVWVRPRVGVFQIEGSRWMFNIHGSMEVQFVGLPSELEAAKLESLRKGEMDVLLDIPGRGPSVESKYYQMGRVYGLTMWTAHLFAMSVDSPVSAISLSDHKDMLEKLVQEGFLVNYSGQSIDRSTYLVLAS